MLSHDGRYYFRNAVREAVGDGPAYQRAGKILLIGELNPYGAMRRYALYPEPPMSAGGRLCRQIFGLPEDQYLAMWRVNLCGGWWNNQTGRATARVLLGTTPVAPAETEIPWSIIVLLGRKVADCALRAQSKFLRFDPFTVKTDDERSFVTLPHPSGRCREWNDPRTITQTREIMKTLAPEMRWGGRED